MSEEKGTYKTPQPMKDTVTNATPEGFKDCPAVIAGKGLAVVELPRPNKDGYIGHTITNIPTGYFLSSAQVAGVFFSRGILFSFLGVIFLGLILISTFFLDGRVLGVLLGIIIIITFYLDRRWSIAPSRGSVSIEWRSLEFCLVLGVVLGIIGIFGWFIYLTYTSKLVGG